MLKGCPLHFSSFIGADGAVYNGEGRVISPPTLSVYVPGPQTDPVGRRMDLDLAALIREVRTEAGVYGDEAYAAAYRRLFGLGPDDPVPALAELPWRKKLSRWFALRVGLGPGWVRRRRSTRAWAAQTNPSATAGSGS